jgi:S-adenosylmethionine decarboxylase
MRIKRASLLKVEEFFGNSLHIDVYNTIHQPISYDEMKKFIEDLVEDIGMKIHKDVSVEYYRGRDEKTLGYSSHAFLTTSNISCHTNPVTNRVYLDIFSCKNILVHRVDKFLKEYFKTEYISYIFLDR